MPTYFGLPYDVWWFLVFGAVISGYAILDGFDIGAGSLHLLLKKEQSRRIALNAIGPIWDGNEVYLVIGGGALFAGFPVAYAAIFSALYVPFIIFLMALIFRGVAIEFRSKEPMSWWRKTWDVAYCIASNIMGLSLGLMLGNVVFGLPLNAQHDFNGSWWHFVQPFPVMISITTLFLFMMHGAIFLAMKTEQRLFAKINLLARRFTVFFVVSFAITTLYTLLYVTHLTAFFRKNPTYFFIPSLMVLAIANIPRELKKGRFRYAFISSSATIALLLIMVALAVFPYLLYSTSVKENSITVYNAASSPRTMKLLLAIAMIGTPLVVLYTGFVAWTFKGKVKLDEASY